jgi:hypothetical protein
MRKIILTKLKSLFIKFKTGFSPIIKILMPNNKEQKWLFFALFMIFLTFSFFFSLKNSTFPSKEIIDYDVYLWKKNFSDFPFAPSKGGAKHPLIIGLFSPIILLIVLFQNLIKYLCINLELVYVFYNIVSALSIMIIYKFCTEIIQIKKMYAFNLILFFSSFSHILLLSFIPETFQISMLVLIIMSYITVENIILNKKNPLATHVFSFVFVSGITVSNGLKNIISILYLNNSKKEKIKIIFYSVLITGTLIIASFLFDYFFFKILPGKKTITNFFGAEEINVLHEMFFEPLVFHDNIKWWGKGREIFRYNSIFPIFINFVIYSLLIISLIISFRKKTIRYFISIFCIDLFIHLVFKFGIGNLYIYSLHWLFLIPLILAHLFQEIKNKIIIYTINVVILLLTISLIIKNIPIIFNLIS